jgi:hypothetical protein
MSKKTPKPKSLTTELKSVDGIRFDCGYVSRDFATDVDKAQVELEDPYILIHEKKLPGPPSFIPVLETVVQTGKPLLVIAEKIEGEALAMLRVNKDRGGLKVAPVEVPGFGDRRNPIMGNIAIVTGGRVIGEEHGIWLEYVKLDMLGRARKAVITKDETTIIGGAGATLPPLAAAPAEGAVAVKKHWLDIGDAVALIQRKLTTSIGAAQAALCEACASGSVRSRYITLGWNRTPMPAAWWRGGTIDLDRGGVMHGGSSTPKVQINADDLRYWLQEHRASGPSPQMAPPAPPAAKAVDASGRTPRRAPPHQDKVTSWLKKRIEAWPQDKAPPTEQEDLAAARDELRADVRRVQLRNAVRDLPEAQDWRKHGPRSSRRNSAE